MKKIKLFLIIFFIFSCVVSKSQDNDFHRVYEGSFGGFTDRNYYPLYNPDFLGYLFFDFGIGKQNEKKRRLFHFNIRQTKQSNLIHDFTYRGFGFDYTKTKKLFGFDKNGLFIGTAFSLDYVTIDSDPKRDSLEKKTVKNIAAGINFKAEYIHFLKEDMHLILGVRMSIVEVGWMFSTRYRADLGEFVNESQIQTPPPFHFEKINFYLGIGLHKLKKDVPLK